MFVGKNVAMVTYGNEDVADGPRLSNRMSLWDRADGRWQSLFHQETAPPASDARQILRWARHIAAIARHDGGRLVRSAHAVGVDARSRTFESGTCHPGRRTVKVSPEEGAWGGGGDRS